MIDVCGAGLCSSTWEVEGLASTKPLLCTIAGWYSVMEELEGVATPSLLLESSGVVRWRACTGWAGFPRGPLYQACLLFFRGVVGCS